MIRPSDQTIERVLNNHATDDEIETVTRWFATNEGQDVMFEFMDKDIERIERGELSSANSQHIKELYHKIELRIRRKHLRNILFRVAAVLIPFVVILLVTLKLDNTVNLFSAPEYIEAYSPKGKRMQVIFQDGTIAYLNADTKLRYPVKFGISERNVYLEGEAYFVVTPNKQRPFTVDINNVEVKVLGTSFNVNAYKGEEKIYVALDEGRVSIEANRHDYMLQPNEKLIYNRQTQTAEIIKNANTKQVSLWKNDIISLQDAPLSEVIDVLKRWYNVNVEVKDKQAYQYNYTFTTRTNAPLEEVLSELEMISPVHFRTTDQTILVTLK